MFNSVEDRDDNKFRPEFPSLGQLAGVGVCVLADVLLCVHSHARRHNSER